MGDQIITLFSDIDNTLCFTETEDTNKAQERLLQMENSAYWTNNNPCFMSIGAYQALLELIIQENFRFVPVTMRTVGHYQAASMIAWLPEYAITTGGAVILKKDKPLQEWTEIVKSQYLPQWAEYTEMLQALHSIPELKSVMEGIKLTDDVMLEYFVGSDFAQYSKEQWLELESRIRNSLDLDVWECNLVRSLNRLFVIPRVGKPGHYSKELAIEYLLNKEPAISIAAGDSLWDKGMLEFADIAYTQKGSRLDGLVDAVKVPAGTAGTVKMFQEIQSLLSCRPWC